MDIYFSICISFIFFSTIIQIFLVFIFSFISMAKKVILHCIAMFGIITPLFLFHLDFFQIQPDAPIITISLLIFPITFSLVIYNQLYKIRFSTRLPVFIFAATGALLTFLIHERPVIIISLIHMITYSFLILQLSERRISTQQKLQILALSFGIVYLVISFVYPDPHHLPISAGFTTFVTLFLITFMLRNRIVEMIQHLSSLGDLNNRLTHRVSRLKQSNDQFRRIIQEKDLEISQMARHTSLAELTTGIAHELSQPLTGIKGIAQNMIDDINFEEFENLHAVSELMKVCSLVDKSSSIIDHIRKFSRKSVISMSPIDLNKVILNAIDLINLQLKKNSIELVFVLDDNIPQIIGDRISLEQLILNLILNSRDAISEKEFPDDSESGSIKITTFFQDSLVRMVIEDNGTGISEEIIHRIWSPFFTTKRKAEGTGIGLSICNRILKDHRATVAINTSPDGTMFFISFPPHGGGKSS